MIWLNIIEKFQLVLSFISLILKPTKFNEIEWIFLHKINNFFMLNK